MPPPAQTFGATPSQDVLIEVFSELDQETIQRRWRAVNTVLRLSMLTGLQMQLEPSLNLLCDLGAEVRSYDGALVWFWNDSSERAELRVQRAMEVPAGQQSTYGNLFNYWAHMVNRPMLIEPGRDAHADAVLAELGCASVLVVPLFVSNRVAGSLQFFSVEPGRFTREDAQLLWVLSLVAENLLTREQANEGLIRFAFTDYLTGLKTRGYFEQQLEMEIKRSERKRQPFALLMIDIDHFKKLNDTFGHHVGDQVLRDVGAILQRDMREVDTVARYGGEEFVVILPETNEAGAMFVAQRLRRAVEQARFLGAPDQQTHQLSVSIGYALFSVDAHYRRELIEAADEALYAAKAAGRNRVVSYRDMVRTRTPGVQPRQEGA